MCHALALPVCHCHGPGTVWEPPKPTERRCKVPVSSASQIRGSTVTIHSCLHNHPRGLLVGMSSVGRDYEGERGALGLGQPALQRPRRAPVKHWHLRWGQSHSLPEAVGFLLTPDLSVPGHHPAGPWAAANCSSLPAAGRVKGQEAGCLGPRGSLHTPHQCESCFKGPLRKGCPGQALRLVAGPAGTPPPRWPGQWAEPGPAGCPVSKAPLGLLGT